VTARRLGKRASVLECGSPMPLSLMPFDTGSIGDYKTTFEPFNLFNLFNHLTV
jgi:hypothetical protein